MLSTRRWGRLSFSRHTVRLKANKTEKGRSRTLCNYGLCWPFFRSSTLFSLSNSVLPKKTDSLPTREGLWGWTRYEEWIYICALQLLAGGRSTVRAQCSGGWFRFNMMIGIMPGRRSSTVGSWRLRFGSRARTRNKRCTILAAMYVDLDLTDSSNWTHTQRRTTSSGLDERESIRMLKLVGVSSERKSPAFISSFIWRDESTKRGTSLIVVIKGHLWSFTSRCWHAPSLLYDQRDQSARERGYSYGGKAKSSPLLIEPSVRRSSSTCYEAPVFGGSPLLDLERRTSGQGKAQCAWCKWLSFFMR
jgi:hypothetical protein